MLKKLRRASEWSIGRRRDSVLQPAAAAAPSSSDSLGDDNGKPAAKQMSFFDLPAEIRNAIYEYTAGNSTLVIPPKTAKARAKAKASSLPPDLSLLLVCRQTRQEYRPVLLSLATIVAKVAGHDYRNLIHVLSTLPRGDLQSLRLHNETAAPRLWIRMLLSAYDVPTMQDRQPLRCWFGWLHAWNPHASMVAPSIQELARVLTWRYSVEWVRKGRFNSSARTFDFTHVLLRAHRGIILAAHEDMDGMCRNEHWAMLDGLQQYYDEHDEIAKKDLRRGLGPRGASIASSSAS